MSRQVELAAVKNRLAHWVWVAAQMGMALAVSLWLVQRLTGRGWERLVALVTQGTTLLLTVLNPLLGFSFWLVLAPFAPFWNFDLHLGAGVPDLGLVRVGVLSVGFVLLAEIAAGRRRLPPLGMTEVGMVVFVGGMLLATRMALKGMIFAMQTAFDAYVVPLAVYLFARILVDDEKRLRWMTNVLFFVVLYVAFIALHESWTGEMWFYPWGRMGLYTRSLRRVTGLLGNPAYHATIMTVMLPLAIYRYVVAPSRGKRVLYLGLVGVMLLTIAFLYNRAGYLAALAVMSIMAVRFPRWRRLFLPTAVAGILALVLLWGRFTQTEFYLRRLQNQASVNARAQAMRAALDLWRESPIFGIGYPNFGTITLQRGYFVQIDDKWRPAPHNTFFGILSQAGLIAFAGFITMLAGMVREIVTRYRQLREGVERRMTGLWRSTLGIGTTARAESGRAVVALASLVAYVIMILTVDADPAQFSNIVFYTLMGSILGYMAHTHARHAQVAEEA